MKKNSMVIAAALALALSSTACSAKPETAPTVTTAEQTTAAQSSDNTKAETEAETTETEGSENAESSAPTEGTLTGVIDVNKGFMITIISDEDSEAYVFPLDEAQGKLYKDMKAGDRVNVHYGNGLPTPDNTDTVVMDLDFAD